MCRIDQLRHIVHFRRCVTFYGGDLTDARAPPEHRGEHTLPVEHIARRPRSSGRHPARLWWSSKSLQVDDQKAVTAPSLPTPSSACIRSDTFLSLAQRSSFTTCEFWGRIFTGARTQVSCVRVSRERWTAPSRTAPSAALVRDLTFLLLFVRFRPPRCADRLISCLATASSQNQLMTYPYYVGISKHSPPTIYHGQGLA